MTRTYGNLRALDADAAGIPFVPLDGTWILVKNDPIIQETLMLKSRQDNFLVRNETSPTQDEVEAMTQTPLLRIPAVAEILSMSKSKVHELVRSGDIPSVRIDKCVRVRQSDLEAFIERRMTGRETTCGGSDNG
jgi:excisionase family DNA binding protein